MRRRTKILWYGLLAATMALSACSADSAGGPGTCTEGQQTICSCPGGSESIQECGPDGTFGPCDCPDSNSNANAGANSNQSNGENDNGEDSECVNLCQDQLSCPSGQTTSLRGTVYAPNGTLPIPNAAVYVPNVPLDELPPIETGAVCEQCEEQALGSPLVGTITAYDGTFELEDVPVTDGFPLVIRLGSWRRVVEISLDPQEDGCRANQLEAEQTRFPTRHHEDSVHDNLPKTAVSTGFVDAMECVLLQLGVEASEFSRRSEDGRIHLYRANGAVADSELSGACSSAGCHTNACTDRDRSCGTGADAALLQDNLSHHLYEDQDRLNSYDMVIFDCEGSDHTNTGARSDDNLERIRNYVDSGGRMFASHWAYDWLHQNEDLQDTAQWTDTGFGNYTLAFVDDTFPGGETFWEWLKLVDADYSESGPDSEPQIEITDPRGMAQQVNDELATRWVYTDASVHQTGYDAEQYMSFNTPVYADEEEQCGQVSYSAFHVADVVADHGPAFPSYCGTEMTPQEKVLAYMLFDLAACVTEDDTPPDPTGCFPLGDTCQLDEQCCSETCAIESGEDTGTCITG